MEIEEIERAAEPNKKHSQKGASKRNEHKGKKQKTKLTEHLSVEILREGI